MSCGFQNIRFEDVTFEFNKYKICVQCKRPQSPRSVCSNIRNAYKQLIPKNSLFDSVTKGMIAISTDKILNLDDKIFHVKSESEISQFAEQTAKYFLAKFSSCLLNILNVDVLAILLMVKFIVILEPQKLLIAANYVRVHPLFQNSILNAANSALLEDMMELMKRYD